MVISWASERRSRSSTLVDKEYEQVFRGQKKRSVHSKQTVATKGKVGPRIWLFR